MEDSSFSTPKKPIKYKFLRRALHLTDYLDSKPKLLSYAKMRRIYFRKIDEQTLRKGDRHYYSNRKQLNCLTSFNTNLYHESYDKKFVKLMKNLKNIKISFGYSPSVRSGRFLKQMPKNIESIAISGSLVDTDRAQIQRIYRNLSTCRNLRRIAKTLYFERPKVEDENEDQDQEEEEDEEQEQEQGCPSLTKVEYDSINRYLPRLRNLKEFCCVESKEQGLEKYINQGMVCPFITDLTVLCDSDYAKNSAPCFRFHLFPKLRRLTFNAEDIHLEDLDHELGNLSQLKHLKVSLQNGVKGKLFLFEGLCNLPLLDVFDLSMADGIQNDQELLLIEFLQKQTQLVSLSLKFGGSIRSRRIYEDQNQHLETICQSLSSKTKLKYLYLTAPAWSLQSLSRGLSEVGMPNQLKELDFTVFDDISIPSSTPYTKVKGLCDFIERQKLSLRSLSTTLSCVKEDEIINSLVKATGEADKLETFRLILNKRHVRGNYNNYLDGNILLSNIPRESLKGYPSFQKTFTLLNQTLPQLKELSDLTLDFSPLTFFGDAHMINSSVIFNYLPTLKYLKSIRLCLPFINQSIETHPAQALLLYEIKVLGSYCFIFDSDYDQERIEEVDKVLEKTQLQRYIRDKMAFK